MQEFFDPGRAASGLHFLQKYFQTETWSGGGLGGGGSLPCRHTAEGFECAVKESSGCQQACARSPRVGGGG